MKQTTLLCCSVCVHMCMRYKSECNICFPIHVDVETRGWYKDIFLNFFSNLSNIHLFSFFFLSQFDTATLHKKFSLKTSACLLSHHLMYIFSISWLFYLFCHVFPFFENFINAYNVLWSCLHFTIPSNSSKFSLQYTQSNCVFFYLSN